jgi:hypothetical protein
MILLMLFKHVHFQFNRFEIFGEFQQENSYISASDERILDQRPNLDRLLNSTIELLRTKSDSEILTKSGFKAKSG